MKDMKSKIAITLVCIILGIILAIQFKTVNKTIGSGKLPALRSKELAVELNKLIEEKETLENELGNLENLVRQYEKTASEENAIVEELSKERLKYRMFAGYESVNGPGIILTIDDPPVEVVFGDETSYIVDNFDYILYIISYLNASGAEAISINGQRYTAFTELLRVSDYLNINGVSIAPPIIIKAIGAPDDLESALRLKGGVVWELEYYSELEINITQEEDIEIPRYTKIKEFRYAKPIIDVSN